jgi:DHA2 family multidrug resistance protein
VLGVAGAYLFTVHSLSSRRPFINWSVFRDRNLTVGMVITFAYAYISLAPLVLIPTMLQSLKGLEMVTTGVLLIPRGAAQIAAILLVGPLIDRLDPRILIGLGFASFAIGSFMMANYTLDIGLRDVVIPTIFQGLAMAIIWIPTFTLMYSTLAPSLRTDAASLVGLIYTIASSLGVAISVTLLSRSVQTNTEELTAYVVPTNELLRFPEYSDGWNLDSLDRLASIQSEIGKQALMIGYVNVYWVLALLCVVVLPLVTLIRKRTRTPPAGNK